MSVLGALGRINRQMCTEERRACYVPVSIQSLFVTDVPWGKAVCGGASVGTVSGTWGQLSRRMAAVEGLWMVGISFSWQSLIPTLLWVARVCLPQGWHMWNGSFGRAGYRTRKGYAGSEVGKEDWAWRGSMGSRGRSDKVQDWAKLGHQYGAEKQELKEKPTKKWSTEVSRMWGGEKMGAKHCVVWK